DADCCTGVCGPKNPTGRRRCLCRTADDCRALPQRCHATTCEAGLRVKVVTTGAPCDDGNPCTTDDVCGRDGVCRGTPVACPEGLTCCGGACKKGGNAPCATGAECCSGLCLEGAGGSFMECCPLCPSGCFCQTTAIEATPTSITLTNLCIDFSSGSAADCVV